MVPNILHWRGRDIWTKSQTFSICQKLNLACFLNNVPCCRLCVNMMHDKKWRFGRMLARWPFVITLSRWIVQFGRCSRAYDQQSSPPLSSGDLFAKHLRDIFMSALKSVPVLRREQPIEGIWSAVKSTTVLGRPLCETSQRQIHAWVRDHRNDQSTEAKLLMRDRNSIKHSTRDSQTDELFMNNNRIRSTATLWIGCIDVAALQKCSTKSVFEK